MEHYSHDYFRWLRTGAERSASHIVPMVLDLIRPSSVIDVGCGSGGWVSAFMAAGIQDAWGVDGDWVDAEALVIPRDRFIAHDLTSPLHLNRPFDLVVSLEVAEHLPEESADTLVASLVHLGPVILFSAAIPHQGGENHLNEQWPSWWAERFESHGYRAIDCLRSRLWNTEGVDWWYAQNALMFVREADLWRYPSLVEASGDQPRWPLPLVHPGNYLHQAEVHRRSQQLPNILDELRRLIPDGARVLVVDEDLRSHLSGTYATVPFLERGGEYWGVPSDDAHAIDELERLRASEARWLVFGDYAFWWLDHFAGFRRHLETACLRTIRTGSVAAFELPSR